MAGAQVLLLLPPRVALGPLMPPSLPTSSSHIPCSTLGKGTAPLGLKFGPNPELPSRIPAVTGWHKGSRDGPCSAREGPGLSRVLDVLGALGEWHMSVAVPPNLASLVMMLMINADI